MAGKRMTVEEYLSKIFPVPPRQFIWRCADVPKEVSLFMGR